jgi:SAM-dependent methyltransferase
MNAVFEDYASYYDLCNAGKEYTVEVEYLLALAKRHGAGQIQEVLDLGCGTGLHACSFAELGYAVTGVDRSREMLQVALARAHGISALAPPIFLNGDISSLALGKQFDLVVTLFHVICYQTTNLALQQTFLHAAEHLREGGLFIFDLWYGPAVLHQKPLVRVKRAENQELSLCRIAEPILRENLNCVEVNFDIEITYKKDGSRCRLQETHLMRYLFLPEIQALLQQAGCTLLGAEQWLTGAPPSLDSWSLCCVARKEKASPA